MSLDVKQQNKIIRQDGILLSQNICNIVLDEAEKNRFEYGINPLFPYPRFTQLYWFAGRLFHCGTHGEVIDLTEKYWPIANYCRNKYEKENKQ